MRNKKYFIPFTLVALLVSGCTPSNEQVDPTPEPSTSETTSAPEETTSEPAPEPSETTEPVTIDRAAVDNAPYAPQGDFNLEQVQAAVQSSVEFTQSTLTNNLYYTGQWQLSSFADITNLYQDRLMPVVSEPMSQFTWENIQQRQTIASVFPVFIPTESLVTPEDCLNTWESCVSENIVFTQPEVVAEGNRIKVSYTVTTSRALLLDEQEATSTLNYTIIHWMIADESGAWKIDAYNNSSIFGQVKVVE